MRNRTVAVLAAGTFAAGVGAEQIRHGHETPHQQTAAKNEQVVKLDAQETHYAGLLLEGRAKVIGGLPVKSQVEAKPTPVAEVPVSDALIDKKYEQGVDALKQGDMETASDIQFDIIESAGTKKDYDGDGDKEFPYKALRDQLDKADK